jgi:hypothetical protein
MPYISDGERSQYRDILKQLPELKTKGDLEYCIFWLQRHFMGSREFRYSTLHEAVYAATHCADEFRRRFLDERENQAREQNGDVYPE